MILIRALYEIAPAVPEQLVANLFGVSQATISNLLREQTWKEAA